MSCAIFFVLFWAGIALAVLGAVLLVTAGCAAATWVWIVGGYLVGRLVYGLVSGTRGRRGPLGKPVDEVHLQATWDNAVEKKKRGEEQEAEGNTTGVGGDDGQSGRTMSC